MFEGLFQPMHLLVITGIVLLIFGPKKLPELGKGLGEVRWTPKSRPFFVDNKLMSGKVELCVFRSFSFEKGRSFQ